ncbi:hypothetical protein BEWA_036800 [Theileria equi strain WA]|uniref:Uncharacterized protein n=1 Tax=Theileria equi strain WA TaxID=1537102 RepID=L1LED2_THEEQ|nr:hypothetical protein BEWA_036800 [Theileria equi strain WA]EKX73644.1 hypothetical protein BEWA_036800 [Theileria equi strain WA]|eukprot:XP_004833096.1 hypothetical protein BEWA_036800 [Theileria equi strain WA]
MVKLRKQTKTSGTSSTYGKGRGEVLYVVDGDISILTAKPGDNFQSCFTYERDGYSSILSLTLGNGKTLCYLKDEDRWK